MSEQYSITALAWSTNVKEAALYFEHVIPMDRYDNYDEELFAVLPDYLKDERFNGVVKELWDVYISSSSFIEERSHLSEHYLKEYKAAIKNFEDKYALNKLPKFGHDEFCMSTSKAEVPFLSLQNLEIVDPSKLTWEMVLDFRKDRDAVSKIRRLRHFLEANYTNKNRSFIEDDLALKIEDYKYALKKWDFDTKAGVMGILLKSKTIFSACAASIALAFCGNEVLSAASLTSGILVETGNVVLEISKRSKEKKELRRKNPFDYLIELNIKCKT